MRAYLIIALFIGLVGSGAYVAKVMADNDRLRADVATAVSANQSYVDAMHAMAREQVKLNQQIIERDETQRTIQRNLATTQRRLRDASRAATVTDIQRQCLDTDLPGPVIDILRQPAGGDENSRPDQGMPSGPTLLGSVNADIHRLDVCRPDRVHRNTAGRCARIAGRPGSDTGFLPW